MKAISFVFGTLVALSAMFPSGSKSSFAFGQEMIPLAANMKKIAAFFTDKEGAAAEIKGTNLIIHDPRRVEAIMRNNIPSVCGDGQGGSPTSQVYDLPCNAANWNIIHWVIFAAGVDHGTVISACDSRIRPSIVVMFD